MKNPFPIILLGFSFIACFHLNAQQSCTVLNESINESYKGACKKGLAHGKGIAKGKDTYKGSFKKGLPDGQGICTFAEGDSYNGSWKKGQRFGKGTYMDLNGGKYIGDWRADLKEGEGTYYLKLNDQDTVLAGLWEKDEYIGPKPEKPYIIVYRRSIDRLAMFKISDGNRLTVRIMQNGTTNKVTDLRFNWSSGSEFSTGGNHQLSWENMEFPFEGRITYVSTNKLKTSSFTAILDFIINEPGNWELVLHN